ncbi:hypothetical protein D9611_002794 [Ephemerocybe angulata]|uniref:Uncharacterized protein n=1 Tax=Ephemerocybe angulata TaxID=980116 RepID=A0A8H5C347_9AGAR|nr:hypothetical protein D9611_002794 [Tulosesus angulatus]
MPAPGKRARQRANRANSKAQTTTDTEHTDVQPPDGSDPPSVQSAPEAPLDPAAGLIASLKEYSAGLSLDDPLAAEALKHGVRLGLEIGERRMAARFQEMVQALTTFMESCERRFDSTHDAAYAMGVAAERALWTPNPASPGLPSLPSPFVDQCPSITELCTSLTEHFPNEIPPELSVVIQEVKGRLREVNKHERRLQMFEEMSFLRGKHSGILEERARLVAAPDPASDLSSPNLVLHTSSEMGTQTDFAPEVHPAATAKAVPLSSEATTQTDDVIADLPTTATDTHRVPAPTSQRLDSPLPPPHLPTRMLPDTQATPRPAGNDTSLDWADETEFDTDTKPDPQLTPSVQPTPSFVRDFSDLRSPCADPWKSIHQRTGRDPRTHRHRSSRTQRNYRRAREYDRIQHARRPHHFPMLVCSCMHRCPVASEKLPTVPEWRTSSRTQRGRCY